MEKNRNKALITLAAMTLSIMWSSGNAQAAGCSNWYLKSKGTARCTNKLCPGGFKRRERTDTYIRRCVRDDGTVYSEPQTRTVFLGCSCT